MASAAQIKATYPGYAGWNDTAAIEADYNATGGAGKGNTPWLLGGGGTAPGGDAVSEFANVFSQLAVPGYAVPPITLGKIEEYEKLSLEELRPYYERILKEEGGDVERAKARIEQDYASGLRYRREDKEQIEQRAVHDALLKIGWTEEDATRESQRLIQDLDLAVGRAREDAAREIAWLTQHVFPEEQAVLMESLNRRGLMDIGTQGLAGKVTGRLGEEQAMRQQAIERSLRRTEETTGITRERGLTDIERARARTVETTETGEERTIADALRALQRYEEEAGVTKGRGLEDITTQWERRQFLLGEEKKEKAGVMARTKREEEYLTKSLERQQAVEKLYGIYG